MPGLIGNQMQGQQQAAPQQVQGQPSQGQGQPTEQVSFQPGDEKVTPEEQKQYEQTVLAGMKVLYSDETHPQIMQMLQDGADDPAKALADVAALVISQLDKQSGGKMPEVVIFPAAQEILTLAGELAQEAGLFQVDENTMGRAVQNMLMTVAEEYGVDLQDLQALIDSVPEEERQKMVAQQEQYAGGQPPGQQPAQQPTGMPV